MSLRSPDLDDRSFDDLVAEARQIIERSCPQWTDRSPSDPGMVLVDVFAHLTEVMLYRLNQVPQKSYVEFLRLIGVNLHAPAAASASLRFTLARPLESPVEIPRGVRVTTPGGREPPVFTTLERAVIAPGETEAQAVAFQCLLAEAEIAGYGSGLPGLSVKVRHTPIVAATDERLRIVVGVETDSALLSSDTPALEHGGKAYRIWREVNNFSEADGDKFVFIADRRSGVITFAPAVRLSGEGEDLGEEEALAEIPPKGAQIRVWYCYGGGQNGNVTAGTLTQFKDAIPGVKVNNPAPASGGRAAESLDNAMKRGSQEIHSLQRAVTARDFELLAQRSSGAVDRAKAFTRAEIWAHAQPGTAEVVLVPSVPEALRADGRVTRELLGGHESKEALHHIQRVLDERRPLGTHCVLSWARYKQVVVRGRVVVYRDEDNEAVKARILRRLNETITPLAPGDAPGWPFGHALTNWHIYKILSAEPGVRAVPEVTLLSDEAPDGEVRALARDGFQARTWYAAAGDAVYRSMNDGEGWERVGSFAGANVTHVEAYPPGAAGPRLRRAGLLAIVIRAAGDSTASRVYFSSDCGESWVPGPTTDFRIEDLAWIERGEPGVMLATELGLYYVPARADAVPEQVVADAENLARGFYAVASTTDAAGGTSVAVAARGKGGVFLSHDGGRSKTFKHIGLANEEVRVLEVQHRGLRRYLWAGLAAVGEDPGQGCRRWLLTGTEENPEGWVSFANGWQASSCRGLAFEGSTVYAATRRGGVLALDTEARDARWQVSAVNCGLPLRELKKFESVDAVACSGVDGKHWLMAAGGQGIYRSADKGGHYSLCSGKEFRERVTLPPTWLFCSGRHELTVTSEDEAASD